MPQLRISLLGVPCCAWEGHGPIRLGRPGQLLLGYLVLHRGRPHSRERLAEVLWGEAADDGRPRRRLNTTLWRLRRSLAPPGAARTTWLRSTAAGEIGFAPEAPPAGKGGGAGAAGCWIDIEAFTGATRQALRHRPEEAPASAAAELETAVGLYAGDLLEGCYDDWVLPERRAMQERLLAGLEWLMRHHAAAARLDAALAAGRRLLMHDPLREDVHRGLMTLYERAGRRGEALRQYDYCRDVLASELGVTPEAETEALLRRLLATAGGGGDAVTATPPAAAPRPADGQVLRQVLEQVQALERVLLTALATRSAPPRGPGGEGGATADAARQSGPRAVVRSGGG